ncbi:PLP-dependent transferase [Paenibacillus durus]|nr:PLP-dependent transferase [Paenibacillus durus]
MWNPFSLGIDLVLHSISKFIGGHSDAIGESRHRLEGTDRADQ